jgi:Asp-tRNA(Asn)/Glu-tRNA(Gln) amidotransferase A subunit family amidase
MDDAEYRKHDAVGLAELVAAGGVTPAELLAAATARSQAVNGRINAVVRAMPDEARATLERLPAPEAGAPGARPFHGVPFLIKDLGQDYAGVPTSAGSRSLAQLRPDRHSAVVRRWLDAGLVIFGKTNTPEFGAKGVTEPHLFGPARNPWNTAHTPGGSSGGSAAAVAAGIVPVAGASDGGGSIRIPAACCGLFGLKAGRGLVATGPARGEEIHGAVTDGVISRTVRDSAAMLDLLAGSEPDSGYLAATPAQPLRDQVGRDPGRLRIGLSLRSALNPTPHPDAVAAVRDAADLLTGLGHEVEEADVDYDDAALSRDFLLMWFATMAATVDEARRATGSGRSAFEPDTRIMAELGRRTSATGYLAAHGRWHDYTAALADFHRRHDLLLTPALARPPLRIGELDTPRLLDAGGRVLLRLRLGRVLTRLGLVESIVRDNLAWVPYSQLANLTGRPAMSVPTYWTAAGLPLGVQFVAPLGGEATLLRLAGQLESARPWADRLPPL